MGAGRFILYPVAGLTALFPNHPRCWPCKPRRWPWPWCRCGASPATLGGLKSGGGVAVVFAYCAYPAVHTINLSDFHPEALAVPALFAAVLTALRGRWNWFAVFALLVVTCRSDLAFALSGLGLLVLLEGRRRPGTAISLAGLAYGLVAMTAIQPRFSHGKFPTSRRSRTSAAETRDRCCGRSSPVPTRWWPMRCRRPTSR